MKKWILSLLVAAQALAVTPAFAGSKGRMNTAALLTAGAVASWVNSSQHRHSAGRRNTALALTAGSAYAWYSYNKEKKAEKRRERARAAYYRYEASRNRRLANYYRSRYYASSRSNRYRTASRPTYRRTRTTVYSRRLARR